MTDVRPPVPTVAAPPVSNLKGAVKTNVPLLHTVVSICHWLCSSCAEWDSNFILLTKTALTKQYAGMGKIQQYCLRLAKIETGAQENPPGKKETTLGKKNVIESN